ncbi:Lipoprotein [Streptomyces albidoflavus]|nr:Lipoprotein [Streptomyces albidoflavus]EFE81520.1 lipoprotein [Streptomyces albidoflavus]QLP94160.1 Lipoprotein [Streptomyces albidoflavus]WAE12489.1 Lipoprotein [Streptomyces albidoflavus]WAE18129.1 Lipoprotein [Streptomyces albidoflavus]
MVNRRSLPAVSLAVAAALALSACGGGDGKSGEDDKIAGADGGGGSSAAPEPGASPEAERPAIKLPTDMKNVFEGGGTGDPVAEAVLRDSEGRINSLDEAIHTRSLERPAFGFYNTGDAARGAAVWVQGFYDDKITWTGTVRYYDRKVTVEGKKKDKATLSYCADESKAFNKDLKSGKVSDAVDGSGDSLVAYTTRLVKNDKGVWQTTDVYSKRGTSPCQ